MKKINPSVNKAQLECFLTVFNFEYSCGGVNYTISTIIVQNSEYGHTVALKDQSVSNLIWQVKWKVLCFPYKPAMNKSSAWVPILFMTI